MMGFVLVPAYGRDYVSAQDAEKDFFDNLDFRTEPQGQYCNLSDVVNYTDCTMVEIRYNRLRDATVVRIER